MCVVQRRLLILHEFNDSEARQPSSLGGLARKPAF